MLMAVLGISGGRLVSRMRRVPNPAISSRTVEISPDVSLYTVFQLVTCNMSRT